MNETKPTTTPNTQATGGDFAYMSAVDIAELVRRRKVSPVEVVRASLERIEALEPTLNAFVTLTPDAGEITAEDIIQWCKDRLAHFKAPHWVIFGTLPKTSTGKIQKFVLRERALDL